MLTNRLYSTGHMAATLQMSVQEIERELEAAGHSPEIYLNDIPYWGENSLAMLRKRKCHAQLESLKSFMRKEGIPCQNQQPN